MSEKTARSGNGDADETARPRARPRRAPPRLAAPKVLPFVDDVRDKIMVENFTPPEMEVVAHAFLPNADLTPGSSVMQKLWKAKLAHDMRSRVTGKLYSLAAQFMMAESNWERFHRELGLDASADPLPRDFYQLAYSHCTAALRTTLYALFNLRIELSTAPHPIAPFLGGELAQLNVLTDALERCLTYAPRAGGDAPVTTHHRSALGIRAHRQLFYVPTYPRNSLALLPHAGQAPMPLDWPRAQLDSDGRIFLSVDPAAHANEEHPFRNAFDPRSRAGDDKRKRILADLLPLLLPVPIPSVHHNRVLANSPRTTLLDAPVATIVDRLLAGGSIESSDRTYESEAEIVAVVHFPFDELLREASSPAERHVINMLRAGHTSMTSGRSIAQGHKVWDGTRLHVAVGVPAVYGDGMFEAYGVMTAATSASGQPGEWHIDIEHLLVAVDVDRAMRDWQVVDIQRSSEGDRMSTITVRINDVYGTLEMVPPTSRFTGWTRAKWSRVDGLFEVVGLQLPCVHRSGLLGSDASDAALFPLFGHIMPAARLSAALVDEAPEERDWIERLLRWGRRLPAVVRETVENYVTSLDHPHSRIVGGTRIVTHDNNNPAAKEPIVRKKYIFFKAKAKGPLADD